MPHLSRTDKHAIEEAKARQGGQFDLKRYLWEEMTERVLPERTRVLGIEGTEIFAEIPVTFPMFIKNYMNEKVYEGPQEDFACDMYGEDPQVWDNTYNEGIALWGMGSGKDWICRKLVLYGAYWLTCLRNPQEFFGQGRGETLDIVNVSINATQAKDVFFEGLKRDIKNTRSPKGHPAIGQQWFGTWGMDLREGSEGGDLKAQMVEFPNGIRAHSLHSEKYSFEGLNIIISVLDEIAAFALKDAQSIHNGIRENSTSRFGQKFKMFLLSYKRHDYDYLMIRFRESKHEKKVCRSGPWTTWDVNRSKRKEDFVEEYARTPKRARRVYECRGSEEEEQDMFFTYPKRITGAINKDRVHPLVTPSPRVVLTSHAIPFIPSFKGQRDKVYTIHLDLAAGLNEDRDVAGFCLAHAEEWILDPGSEGFDFMQQILRDEEFELTEEQVKMALTHPRVDPSSIQKVGVEEMRPQRDGETAEQIMDRIAKVQQKDLAMYSRKVVIDFYAQLVPPKGQELQIQYVEREISRLRKDLDFNIQMISADQWQSKQLLQNLARAGIRTKLLSTKKKYDLHTTVKSMIYTGQLDYYANSVFIREAEELIDEGGVVDHPINSARREEEEGKRLGSSDVWEAVVGAVENAMTLPLYRARGTAFVTIGD